MNIKVHSMKAAKIKKNFQITIFPFRTNAIFAILACLSATLTMRLGSPLIQATKCKSSLSKSFVRWVFAHPFYKLITTIVTCKKKSNSITMVWKTWKIEPGEDVTSDTGTYLTTCHFKMSNTVLNFFYF